MSPYRLPGRLQHKDTMREQADAEINGYVLRCMAGYAVVFLIVLAVVGK